jgi:Ammonia permease
MVTITLAGMGSITPASRFRRSEIRRSPSAPLLAYSVQWPDRRCKETPDIDDTLVVFAVHPVGAISRTVMIAVAATPDSRRRVSPYSPSVC